MRARETDMADSKWSCSGGNILYFEKLSHKLSSLVYTKTDGGKKQLQDVLTEFNSLDFNVPCLKSNEKGVLVINQCCYLITPEDEDLVLMACDLFMNLLNKQQVSIESKTLSLAVSWCLQCLKYRSNVAVLKCLQVLVKGNHKRLEQQLAVILGELKRISNNFELGVSEETDIDLVLHCLKCMENIVTPALESDKGKQNLTSDVMAGCFEIFKEVLTTGKTEKGTQYIGHCKCLIACMKGIGNLLEASDYVLDTYIRDILGIAKGYMLYGLPGDEGYRVEKLLPSQVAVPDVFRHSSRERKLKGKYDKKSKKIPVSSIASVDESETCTTVGKEADYVEYNDSSIQPYGPNFSSFKTSDSDYSEDELGQNSKMRLNESKVRQCGLILLGLVIKKTESKLFTGYLPTFLPDGTHIAHVRTLITCLLKDPSPRCRAEVVGILTMILTNFKQYFLQADNASRTSFITFSTTVGNIIKELHRSLPLALIAESSVMVINRLLKCICELIRCTPYAKLDLGLITRLSKYVMPFMNHKDVNVCVSALSVFGCIVSVGPEIQEVRDVVMKPVPKLEETQEDGHTHTHEEVNSFHLEDEDEVVYEEDGNNGTGERSWLLDLCLENVRSDLKNPALTIESLEVAGALVRNFFAETVVRYPSDFIDILQTCSKRPEYLVRLYGGKLLDTVFNSLQFSLTLEDESLRAPISLVTELWGTLLPGPVTSLIQSDSEPMLRCTGCDCIANVRVLTNTGYQTSVHNSFIFDLLPAKHQILCVTLLFGCVLDESPVVRSTAVRALAILVLFPVLMEDPLFFCDATDAAVETARDENSGVRYQSAFLLGNLTEFLLQSNLSYMDDDMTQKSLVRLLETGIKLSEDTPKIRPAALRAIGNILRTIKETDAINQKHYILDGLGALIKNATTGTFMKARWNSCYAIATSLKNSLVYRYGDIVAKIFITLTNLVQNYKNFKVRISAACALSAPPERRCYSGEHYMLAWRAVLNALENSKNVYDVNEYQHRDQLVDQLCFVMAHLLNLIQVNDLIPVQDIVVHHLDSVKQCMAKFQDSILPERGDIILRATARIHNLLDVRDLRCEHRGAISMFESLLGWDT